MPRKKQTKVAVNFNEREIKDSLLNGHRNGEPQASQIHDSARYYSKFYRTSEIFGDYTKPSKELITEFDRKSLLNKCRYIYENVAPCKAAINQIADYAVGDSWQAEYVGPNKEWGKLAEEWVNNWFQICDTFGNDFLCNLRLMSTALDRDGDILLHLTYASDGQYPFIELIGSDAIKTSKDNNLGIFNNYNVFDGVIYNESGRPIGYNVEVSSSAGGSSQQISTQDGLLIYEPNYSTQYRGYSPIGTSLIQWQEYRDFVAFEIEGIKNRSAISFIEKNENGGLTPGQFQNQPYNFSSSVSNVQNAQQPLYWKYYNMGTIRYFGSNDSVAGISPIENNNPGPNVHEFVKNHLLRGCFNSLGWPLEMYDINGLNSANVRAIHGGIVRKLRHRQATLYYAWRKAVRYATAKAIKLGLLPFDESWQMLQPVYPASPSIDLGRDVKGSIDLLKVGGRTLSDIYGESGDSFENKIDQRISEVKTIIDKCKAAGVPLDMVYSVFPNQTNNEPPTQMPEEQ